MTEKPYVISLPVNFPEQVTSNLENYDRDTERKIANIYSGITKKSGTWAASPRDAMGHLFFREIPLVRDAKLFTKMFSSDANRYAFEIPNLSRDENYLVEHALEFRIMELALDIAEIREISSIEAYREARELINVFKRR